MNKLFRKIFMYEWSRFYAANVPHPKDNLSLQHAFEKVNEFLLKKEYDPQSQRRM